MQNKTPYEYMQLALQLAAKGCYTVSPNPMVGCVIVKNDKIIGTGFHLRAGEAHAEIIALKEAGNKAENATVYLSLEPCAHYGKTPPCINALIAAGIQKVFIACLDPNPLVSGKGAAALQRANIEVDIGLGQKEATEQNESFFHYITHKSPFVISKWAMSLDGKTIVNSGDSPKISSDKSLSHAHHLRQAVDAILVGANTIRCDNPQLTVRHSKYNGSSIKQPIRIIVSTSGNIPLDSHVFSLTLPGKTILVSTKPVLSIANTHIENLVIPKNSFGQVNLFLLLEILGKREITSVLVEGGMMLHQSFINENLVNKFHVYLAPNIISFLDKKRNLEFVKSTMLGTDTHLIAINKGENICSEEL